MTIASDKPMDLAAATQRIAWLDEERRRDHAEIARLTQEMASALTVLKDQAVQIRDTGNRLNSIETGLTLIPRLQDAITATRSEMLPLHDADIHLQDEIQRQAKDHQAQTDQSARLASEFSTRIETLSKNSDGLAQLIHALDTQRKDHSERQADIAARLDSLSKAVDNLAGRIHLLETREKDRSNRDGAFPAQIEALVKGADGLSGRIHLLETRDKDRSNRESAVVAQIEALVNGADGLSGRLHLLEVREKDRPNRESAAIAQIEAIIKGAESLAARLQLLETRDKDRSNQVGAIQTQLGRLDVNQAQAVEDVKRSVARVESVMTDIQQMRHDILLAQQEESKQRKDDAGLVADLRAALLALQSRVDGIAEIDKPLIVRLQALEDSAPQMEETRNRLLALEEQTLVIQSTYKGLQEVEDTHWNTVIPAIERDAEEANNTSQSNAATVQELVTASQALKESVRELQVNLVNEHSFSEELAAALRGLIEEDLQTRLATTQKQLQTLRRLANTPVETQATDEQ